MINLILFLLILGVAGVIVAIYLLPKVSKIKIILIASVIIIVVGALIFYEIYNAAQTLPPDARIINKYEITDNLFAGDTRMIYKLDFDGKATPLLSDKTICCFSSFSLSRDKQKVVFVELANTGNGYAYYLSIMDINGKNKKRLLNLNTNSEIQGIRAIKWSPVNNNEIAFLANYNYDKESYSLYLFDIKTKTLRIIAKDFVSALGPPTISWSPDGKKIVFTSIDGAVTIVNKDGSNLHSIISEGNVPAWSPNGRYIMYRKGKYYMKKFNDGSSDGGYNGNGNYYLFDLEKNKEKEIFNNKQFKIIPLDVFVQSIWSSDSKYILLYKTYDLSFKTDFWIIDMANGEIVHHFKSKIKPQIIYWGKNNDSKNNQESKNNRREDINIFSNSFNPKNWDWDSGQNCYGLTSPKQCQKINWPIGCENCGCRKASIENCYECLAEKNEDPNICEYIIFNDKEEENFWRDDCFWRLVIKFRDNDQLDKITFCDKFTEPGHRKACYDVINKQDIK
ncbi:MAG TPA: hypothetical protein ENL06_02245 [Candidatus Portnoybacteria bacterium]|nr:hypothetical protein [Candidatus Portnoybacteria bacterium]